MSLHKAIRNSNFLRRPLMAITRWGLSLLESGPGVLRRAVYDAMPVPYIVTGHAEHFVVSTADKVIGRELFLHGEFDFTKLQSALEVIEREGLPRPSHLVDVGANIGTIVIPALKRGLMGSATAIEPHPDNIRLLRANLALNGIVDQVRVLAQAVGAEPNSTLMLEESGTNSGNHSIGKQGIPVYSSRLDDLNLPTVGSLLWMDIEGYEGHALQGAKELLNNRIPVVCEFNPDYLIRSGGLEKLADALREYRVFDLTNLSEETTIPALARLYAGDARFTDILAIPSEMKTAT